MNLIQVCDLLLLIKTRNQLNNINSLDEWDWDSDTLDKDHDDYSDQIRRLRYYALPIDYSDDPDLKHEELILTKKVDLDFEAKTSDRKWAKVLHPRNQIPSWPDYDPRTNDYYDPQGEALFGGIDPTDFDKVELQKQLVKSQRELAKLKTQCQEELQKRDSLNNQQRQQLEEALNKLNQAGENQTKLQQAKLELEAKLNEMGIQLEQARVEREPEIELESLSTTIINAVPQDGKVRFGEEQLQRNSQLVSFNEGETSKVKKLTINECLNLIRLDLKGCSNLEKITFKKSKWNNVVNIKDCVSLKKVSVKDCEDVSLTFLQGTNVQEVKII